MKDTLGTVKDPLGNTSTKDCASDPRGSPLGMYFTGKELLEKHIFVSHKKHMQLKITESTLFAIDIMYYVNFRI